MFGYGASLGIWIVVGMKGSEEMGGRRRAIVWMDGVDEGGSIDLARLALTAAEGLHSPERRP